MYTYYPVISNIFKESFLTMMAVLKKNSLNQQDIRIAALMAQVLLFLLINKICKLSIGRKEMTYMKRLIGIMGILLLAGLFASSLVYAAEDTTTEKSKGRMGMQRGKAQIGAIKGKTSNLTAEQQEQIEKLQKKFREDNADTIKQLMTKRFDFNTILTSDKPDADKAKAVQKEISDLTAKLAQKRIDLYFELLKINPDAKFGQGLGRGRGMVGKTSAED
jgi:Spy/CpxP family protein refolding chaperone